jgi:hypothetical protein
MPTDRLIDRLCGELRPVPRNYAARRLGMGLGLGLIVSSAVMLVWLGVRPDFADAMETGPFWIKFAYTLGTAAAMLWLLERLARPGARTALQTVVSAVPLTVIVLLGLIQWAVAAPGQRPHLTLGGSYDICPWRIAALSIPLLIGGLWAMRGLAPTRPALAGAVAGVCAGGAGAFVYAFHCDESAMTFVAIWYTLGIAASGLAGALIGRRLLRW